MSAKIKNSLHSLLGGDTDIEVDDQGHVSIVLEKNNTIYNITKEKTMCFLQLPSETSVGSLLICGLLRLMNAINPHRKVYEDDSDEFTLKPRLLPEYGNSVGESWFYTNYPSIVNLIMKDVKKFPEDSQTEFYSFLNTPLQCTKHMAEPKVLIKVICTYGYKHDVKNFSYTEVILHSLIEKINDALYDLDNNNQKLMKKVLDKIIETYKCFVPDYANKKILKGGFTVTECKPFDGQQPSILYQVYKPLTEEEKELKAKKRQRKIEKENKNKEPMDDSDKQLREQLETFKKSLTDPDLTEKQIREMVTEKRIELSIKSSNVVPHKDVVEAGGTVSTFTSNTNPWSKNTTKKLFNLKDTPAKSGNNRNKNRDNINQVITRAIITRAIITRAIITRAIITRAIITRAIITRAIITRAIITRAIITRATLLEEKVSGGSILAIAEDILLRADISFFT